jgi:hypothetical protein
MVKAEGAPDARCGFGAGCCRGGALGIPRHTVHTYLDRLYRKLGVNSRAQLISVLFAAYVEMSHTAD